MDAARTDDSSADTGTRLVTSLAGLTSMMTDQFSLVELLHRLSDETVRLAGADHAGVLLEDSTGNLRVLAATSEASHLLEVLQVQQQEGPCFDCIQQGRAVHIADLAESEERWPTFTPAALGAGFAAVTTLPMRLRQQAIGAVGMFRTASGKLTPAQLAAARALADLASIGLVHQRTLQETTLVAEQLQSALQSRIEVEQAKGLLAERLDLDMDAAFKTLRRHAAAEDRTIEATATALVTGRLQPESVGQ